MPKKKTPPKLEALIEGWAEQLWPPNDSSISLETTSIVNLMGNEILLVRRELEDKLIDREAELQDRINALSNENMAYKDDVLRLNKTLDEALRGIGAVASWREREREASSDLEDEVNFFVDEDLWQEVEDYADVLIKKIKNMRKGKV